MNDRPGTRAVVAAVVAVVQPDPLRIGGREYTFGPVRGALNDVAWYRRLLAQSSLPEPVEPVILVGHEETRAAAILARLAELSRRVRPGGTFFLALVGHGFQVPTTGADEPDGFDEVYAARDAPLFDNQFRKLWGTLDPRVNIVSVVDACHADSIATSFAPENEHIHLGGTGPTQLTLGAARQNETAYSVRLADGTHRGGWSRALEEAWAPDRTYLDWFRTAAGIIERGPLRQTPQLRYLGRNRALLDCVPFLGPEATPG